MTNGRSIPCKAITKEGNPCKRLAMKNSAYCYPHSFRRIRGIPFWTNATIHFIVALITTIGFGLFSMFTGATKENQENVISKVDMVLSAQDKIKQYFSHQIQTEKLKELFPLGYIFFGLDATQIFLPKVIDQPPYRIVTDLRNIKLRKLTPTHVALSIPEIGENPDSVFTFLNHPRIRVMIVSDVSDKKTGKKLYQFRTKILEDYGDAVVMALGFADIGTPTPQWEIEETKGWWLEPLSPEIDRQTLVFPKSLGITPGLDTVEIHGANRLVQIDTIP
jgi:hypothetical protein